MDPELGDSVKFQDWHDNIHRAISDRKFKQLHDIIIEPILARPNGEAEVKELVSRKNNGTTALIMACRNGDLLISDYLIERCGADIEQVSSVTFDGETIEGAPPLWCAAAAGHLNIVRVLVRRGAGVNKTSSTNSTPLRAACFDGHLDIVLYLVQQGADPEIANQHGHTCLMIACYKGHMRIVKFLLRHGVDINRKSIKGNTALHDCAESGSLNIMKLLLSSGARMEEDTFGLTPLMAAAATGHTHIVKYLIDRPGPIDTSQCPRLSRIQRINALELLGATYVDKKRDVAGALRLWLQAMNERVQAGVDKPEGAALVPAYGNVTETRHVEDLQSLVGQTDAIRMQALLIRERVLGPAHPDTSYYVRYRGAVCADDGDFPHSVALWLHALDMQQRVLPPLSQMALSSFLSFAELFAFLITGNGDESTLNDDWKDMMQVLERAILELTNGAKAKPVDDVAVGRLLVIVLHLLSLLVSLTKRMRMENTELDKPFRQATYRLVKLSPCDAAGRSALHLACSADTAVVGRYPVCSFPSVSVTNLLLHVGASPNKRDNDGNTALHVAAMAPPSCRAELIVTLLSHGAHLDIANLKGQRPPDLISSDSAIHEIVSPLDHMTLQCFAAKAIARHRIPTVGRIPTKIQEFVAMH